MPTPDTVGVAEGSSCPPPGCDYEAPCHQCINIFDRIWSITRPWGTLEGGALDPENTCDDWTYTLGPPSSGYSVVRCWESTNYDCPYESEGELQCTSMYELRNIQVIWRQYRVDGCAATEITIRYDVAKLCELIVILGPPYAIEPVTTYEHIFRRTHCNCEDVLGAVPFSETIVTNNASGVTVPDPCNAASATVELEQDTCLSCSCYDCNEGSGEFLLEIAGPGFTGTVTLTTQYLSTFLTNQCRFDLTGFDLGCDDLTDITVFVDCYECNVFKLRLVLSYDPPGGGLGGGSTIFWQGEIEYISCGEDGEFVGDAVGEPYCDLSGYTFSVSNL